MNIRVKYLFRIAFNVSIVTVFILLNSCQKNNIKKNTPKKPNIILINVDDLGWRDLGFMGSEFYETPNIDKLANQGMYFTKAYAGAANCAPSRACLLSGLNTPRHNVFTVSPSTRGDVRTRKIIPIKNTKHLTNTVYTLPKMLKSAGYITSNFGKWHVGKNPSKQGIDYNVGGSSRGNPGKGGYFSPYKIDFIENGQDGEYLTDRLTNEAISFVKKYKDSSFFLYLPFYAVHTPIMGKEKLVEKFKNKKGKNGQDRADYAAMIASVDENIGKLLNTISSLKLEDNTLVIFTSDNGGVRTISYQNPLRSGKGSYYEGGIRVPFIVKWPKHITAGSKNTNMVSQLDIYPTLQNIVKPEKQATILDGLDMLPLLKDTAKIVNRDLFFHFPIYLQSSNAKVDDGRDPLFRTRPGSVFISGKWKLHHYFEDNGLELYNLEDDLGERNNLEKLNPEKAAELFKKLNTWRTTMNAPIPKEKNPKYNKDFEKNKINKILKNN